ncbi:hypothetical protein GUJ93_ZPchr0006g41988 [Zizania palustris]|uniref:Uncharacterized protein n=1 Tax=Zizania palustris TaxID=103762 RepID=A0A8J5T2A2_ZIZPA|nr:hypothetical protein GUJ93_ZPchr0006g41988 [Zizania palustris]
MSSVSAVGDGSGSAAKEKEQELTMGDVARRLQAIEDMIRPLIPLHDQVAALEVSLTAQGQQQQLLNDGLLRAEHALQQGRPPTGHRHDDEDDGFATTHKLEFPKYDSVGDLCRG